MYINDKKIRCYRENDPSLIPWEENDISLVVESTGKFNEKNQANKHLRKSVKKVLLTAPGKDDDITIVMGVNEEKYDPKIHNIISNSSCTTKC